MVAQEFERRVNEMVLTDSAGGQWQIGVKTGNWYRYDGQGWVEDIPQEFERSSTVAPTKAAYVPPPPVRNESVPTNQGQNKSGINAWLTGCLIAGAVVSCCLVLVGGGWLAWRNNSITFSDLPAVSPIVPLTSPSMAPIPLVTAEVPSTTLPEPIAGPGFDPNLVQFQDDFSNPGSGWGTNQGPNGSTDYSNGSFRITVTKASRLVWTNPNQSLQNDISINVEATKAGGPDNNAFGVICRYQDSDNFYYLFITSDGHAGISMFKNNEETMLTGAALISSDAINQGAATNNIRADCVGSTLTLYGNNQQIASVTDSSFSGGDVGLIAAANETPGVDILFDTFIVFKAGY